MASSLRLASPLVGTHFADISLPEGMAMKKSQGRVGGFWFDWQVGAWVFLVMTLIWLLPLGARAGNCLHPQLPRPAEPYAVTKARLESEGRWLPSQVPGRTPPPDPQVGDTWDWYVWDLGGFPVADRKPCTVRGMGDHCYVVVDDDEWLIGIDQADVDRIVQHFDNQSVGHWPEQGIWDLNTGHFGPPPNPLDGLERIFLFYYRFNISADGYFWVFDQYPDGSMSFASNEADVIYLATDSGEPASDYMLAVAAHEFQHLIHFNQDENEEAWVEEGLGELAMWLFGHPDNISAFNSNPDNNLTDWGGYWADYIQTYLWTLYIYEQYGGQLTIWDLTHNPANGMTGYQQVLNGHGYPVQMEDVFGNWGVANFLDDPAVPDGQFGYNGDTLPPFFAYRTHSSYPATGSGSVQAWAAEYIRLTNLSGPPVLEFAGNDLRDFRVAMLATDPVLPTLVDFVALDEFNDGTLAFTDAVGYEEVIITVANVYPSGTGNYTYHVQTTVTEVHDDSLADIALNCAPNPFNPATEISFDLAKPGQVRLTIYGLAGQLVARLVDSALPAGHHRVVWKGRDVTGKAVASGSYFCQLEVDQLKTTHQLVLVR
jgi:hypothetical protein